MNKLNFMKQYKISMVATAILSTTPVMAVEINNGEWTDRRMATGAGCCTSWRLSRSRRLLRWHSRSKTPTTRQTSISAMVATYPVPVPISLVPPKSVVHRGSRQDFERPAMELAWRRWLHS